MGVFSHYTKQTSFNSGAVMNKLVRSNINLLKILGKYTRNGAANYQEHIQQMVL